MGKDLSEAVERPPDRGPDCSCFYRLAAGSPSPTVAHEEWRLGWCSWETLLGFCDCGFLPWDKTGRVKAKEYLIAPPLLSVRDLVSLYLVPLLCDWFTEALAALQSESWDGLRWCMWVCKPHGAEQMEDIIFPGINADYFSSLVCTKIFLPAWEKVSRWLWTQPWHDVPVIVS